MAGIAARRTSTAWKMLSLACLVLIFIAGYPLYKTFYYSFTDARLDDLASASWIGLENYKTLFADDLWWQTVWLTVKFTTVSVSIELFLGLLIALALSQDFPGRSIVRACVLIPWAIPTVVSTRIWEWMYNDQYGIINQILQNLELIEEPVSFLATPSLQIWSMILVDVWKTTPFMVLLILAGLTTIPTEVKEAGKVDGANSWQIFWKITLPLLKPTLIVALTFRILDALRVFDIVYVLFGTNEKTSTMSVYARTQMIDFQEMGLGSTASVVIFLFIGLFILLQTVFLGKRGVE